MNFKDSSIIFFTLVIIATIIYYFIYYDLEISCENQHCKIELHLHLDSAYSPEKGLQLIQKYEPNNTIVTVDDLKKNLTFSSYREFISKWVWMSKFIRSPEDYYDITMDALKTLSTQGLLYVELTYNFIDVETTKVVLKAMSNSNDLYGIQSNLLINFPRSRKNETELIIDLENLKLNENDNNKSSRICGINLSGKESKNSSFYYKNLFKYAKNNGLNTTVHTGEDGEVQEIWDSIHNLNPDRIGHGVKAYQDKSLMEYLKAKQMPMESCVTSNIKTETISPPIANHPIKLYLDSGIKVFFNSDDPLYFGNYIDDEMKVLMKTFGFANLMILLY